MDEKSPAGSLLSSLRGQAVSICALVIALGGTAYAAITVSGQNIRNGTVSGADLRDNSVTGRDLSDGSLARREFRPGTRLRGPRGPAGPRGAGFSTFHDEFIELPGEPGVIARLRVPDTGGYLIVANATATTAISIDCALVAGEGDNADSDRQIVDPSGVANFTSTVVHRFEEPGFATLRCKRSGLGGLSNVKITAIPIGDLVNEPF